MTEESKSEVKAKYKGRTPIQNPYKSRKLENKRTEINEAIGQNWKIGKLKEGIKINKNGSKLEAGQPDSDEV